MSHVDRHFDRLDPLAEHPSPLLFEKGRNLCFAMVVLGAIGVIFGALVGGKQFYFSWLTGWAYCWSMMLGILFFVMLHYLVDAGWDTVIRRPAEQILSAMPVIVLGVIPVIVGMVTGKLYHWTDPHAEHLHGFKAVFLSLPVAMTTVVISSIVFLWLAYVLRRNSIRQDVDGASRWTFSSRKWSAGGILLYALSVTAVALLLLMSLDYHWFSTMFGVYIWTSGVVGGLAIMCLVTLKLRRKILRQYIGSDTVHDIGKLTFAFCCFWAYITFCQYFLIWYGNIPEETLWFMNRWTGAEHPAQWWPIAVLFVLGMFLLPFLILMSATMKRNGKVLGIMAAVILVAHFLEMYWVVQPENRIVVTAAAGEVDRLTNPTPPLEWIWIDLSVVLLLGGLCGVIFIGNLRKVALFPIMDPRLVEALSAEHVEEIEHADTE